THRNAGFIRLSFRCLWMLCRESQKPRWRGKDRTVYRIVTSRQSRNLRPPQFDDFHLGVAQVLGGCHGRCECGCTFLIGSPQRVRSHLFRCLCRFALRQRVSQGSVEHARLGNSAAAAAEEKRRLESLQLVRGFGTALHRPEVLIRCSLLLGGMWGLGIPSCLVRASSLKLTFAGLRQLFSVIGHRSGRERSLRSRVPATGSLPLATEISLLGPSAGTPCRA